MTGITHTQTIEQPPQMAPVTLRVRVAPVAPSFAERGLDLLGRMRTSAAFSERQQAMIAAWAREFDLAFSQYVQGPNEGVSLALCFLLCRVIHPALDAVREGDPKELELARFEGELRDLLATCVPEGETVDQLIASYHDFLQQKELMDAKLEAILRVFQEAMNRLYGRAERLNNGLVGRVQQLKERLVKANNDRQEGMREVHNALEGLAARVRALFTEYDEILKALELQDQRTQQLTASFGQVLEDCKRALQRLKR